MNTRNQPGAKSKHIAPAARVAAAALCAAVILLSSCSNDPIFAAIEDEVELKDPSVRGTITSLVSVGVAGDLYVTNGRIYKKTGGAGDWNEIGMPGYRCAEVATDVSGTDLYGLFQNEDYETIGVYRLSGGSWAAVPGTSDIVKIGSGEGQIFAFAENGSDWNAHTITTTTLNATIATGIAKPIGSALDFFATTAGLFNLAGTAVASTPTSGIVGITTDGTDIYLATAGSVYKCVTAGPTWTTTTHNAGSPTGIAYLELGATDLLLVSGAAGYGEVTVTGGALGAAQDPGDSATSSISPSEKAQYESSLGQWNLTSIFAVSDGTDYDVYAGVMDTRYDGLWGYHSTDSSPEWNRE